MHSALRAELRGSQRIIESLRTRSSRRPEQSPRRFSSRAGLLSQSDPNKGRTGNPDHGRETITPFRVRQKLSQGLESFIQSLSDRGGCLHLWNTISAKDENGRWRLLPEVKKDLESVQESLVKKGHPYDSFGIRIENGRIVLLTVRELIQQHNAQHGHQYLGGYDHRNGSSSEKWWAVPELSTLQQSEGANTTVVDVPQTQTSHGQEQEHAPETKRDQHAAGGEPPSKDVEDGSISRFYGSSAARRQRSARSRAQNNAYVMPEWFEDRNVFTCEDPQLDPALPPQVVPVSINGNGYSKYALILHTPAARGVDQIKAAEAATVQKEISEPPSDQKPVHAHGSDQDSPNDGFDPLPPHIPPTTSGKETAILPLRGQRYYIDEAQLTELTMTARGRLKLPTPSIHSRRSSGIRSHLIIHYTAPNGEIFLDSLIEDLARTLRSNLIPLDVQDIAALIQKAEIDPIMAGEAENMSYDVYNWRYSEVSSTSDPRNSSAWMMEMDDGDEDSSPPLPSGMPFQMVGRSIPISIDLNELLGGRSRKSNRGTSVGKSFMSDNMISSMGGGSNIFKTMVESLLSSVSARRTKPDTEAAAADTSPAPLESTIIHVKDLKAIQDTNIGKKFLTELYEQVERRRANGAAIMLIGSECSRENASDYDKHRIRTLQSSEHDEISSNIVITPVLPDEASKEALRQDRNARLATINARHLWELLQSKGVPLRKFEPGFWTSDWLTSLPWGERRVLEGSMWNFSYVQRVAAILAGSEISTSTTPINQAHSILEESDRLKSSWAKKATRSAEKAKVKGKNGSPTPEEERIAKIRGSATKHEKKLLSGVIEPKKMSTTFQDIHIPAETVDALQTLTTLSLVRPDAFKYGVLASDRIPGLLLYGPPGTGKTLAAKAVARESGATMLEVSAADINDMYVGEGEKNVKALFSLAKKLSPCVVFLDEADAMFSARSAQGRRVSHRELLNQFLKEWDGMSNDSGSAFIMVATNRPMDLDDAVLRRLPRRLLVDLPTENDRHEILKIHLRHESLAEDVNLKSLASRTPFYSGSDLKNVAVAAALNCVREENELAKKHNTSSNAAGAEKKEAYKYPEKRVLTAQHFEKALEEITASISEDMASLREIKKFDEQYGDKKGKKRNAGRWGFKTAHEAEQKRDTIKVRS